MDWGRAGKVRSGKVSTHAPAAPVENTGRWPTPDASAGSRDGAVLRRDAKNYHSVSLVHAVFLDSIGMWPPPKDVRLFDAVPADVKRAYEGIPGDGFVTWMMGYPEGWTG